MVAVSGLVDPAGATVQPVAAFLRDLQAAGRSAATARSYGMDMLRWFRFLWAVEVPWDRASRIEARDFSRWLQVGRQPRRPHWRRPERGGRWAAGGQPYAPSVRAHSETVLRSFYDFHRDIGTGPILNPFPLDRSRRGRAGSRPSQPDGPAPQRTRTGLYRPRVPKRIPRSIPDEEFNEIFAAAPFAPRPGPGRLLRLHRCAGRANCSAMAGRRRSGRQLISVVRKGSRRGPGTACLDRCVRLAAALPARDGRAIPRGRRQPLWWTLRSPCGR